MKDVTKIIFCWEKEILLFPNFRKTVQKIYWNYGKDLINKAQAKNINNGQWSEYVAYPEKNQQSYSKWIKIREHPNLMMSQIKTYLQLLIKTILNT